jgi:tripartite-type tricarboxylate transporter receptor subunit TctC
MTGPGRRGLLGAGLLALGAAARGARAQAPAWPERAITLIHGFPPGGGADTVSRLVAAPLGEQLGRPVLVEGRPGAGGTSAPSRSPAPRRTGTRSACPPAATR